MSDTDRSAPIGDGDMSESADMPATPLEGHTLGLQQTLPSTEAPGSPFDASASFKTEFNERRSPFLIPSSLTPSESSQVPVGGFTAHRGFGDSQLSGIFSPPTTGLGLSLKRDSTSEFVTPTPQQVVDASPEELRALIHSCIAEHARLKMESAHHKLQFNLLSMQADENMKRATVEHEMTRREVEALRTAEHSRSARTGLSATVESVQARHVLLKLHNQEILAENQSLHRRFKMAKKVIQLKEDKIASLTEERDLLLNRIRENRERFNALRSPGGIFHNAMTPRNQSAQALTPVQVRATPKQTPTHATYRGSRTDKDQNITVLLQALKQENSSAPSTPVIAARPASRPLSKHTRVQSMSSLPTTPVSAGRLAVGGLLPSANLVPQSEPAYRRPFNEDMTGRARRKSRESTISADDHEELSRQALQSIAAQSVAAASFTHMPSRTSRRFDKEAEEEEVYESQASQIASQMLRRNPRDTFELVNSRLSRDETPMPAEQTAKLQAKLFGGLDKNGLEKRKLPADNADDVPSPTKRLRMAGGLRETGRVGLGIQYSRQL